MTTFIALYGVAATTLVALFTLPVVAYLLAARRTTKQRVPLIGFGCLWMACFILHLLCIGLLHTLTNLGKVGDGMGIMTATSALIGFMVFSIGLSHFKD